MDLVLAKVDPPQCDTGCVLGEGALPGFLSCVSTAPISPSAVPPLVCTPLAFPTHRIDPRELLAHHHDDDGDELPPQAPEGAQAEHRELPLLLL